MKMVDYRLTEIFRAGTISGILFVLLLVGVFTGAFNVQPAKVNASSSGETVQIADTDWPMFHDNVTHFATVTVSDVFSYDLYITPVTNTISVGGTAVYNVYIQVLSGSGNVSVGGSYCYASGGCIGSIGSFSLDSSNPNYTLSFTPKDLSGNNLAAGNYVINVMGTPDPNNGGQNDDPASFIPAVPLTITSVTPEYSVSLLFLFLVISLVVISIHRRKLTILDLWKKIDHI